MLKHIIGAALACALAACAHAQDASYRVLGRHTENHGAVTFAWPASGVEARFEGARVTATIEDSGASMMDVTIDGVTTMLDLEPGVQTYTIFSSDTAGAHTIRLTRRSEIFSAPPTTLRAFDVDGRVLPLPAYAHRLLMIGDSISVGYGATGADQTCSYSVETSPPLQSYASQTARAFNAELHLLAISGRGIIRNYAGGDGRIMPLQVANALPDQDAPWDASQFAPELIVINLGANDFSPGYPDANETRPGERYEAAYIAFLRDLRATYPQARIIAAIGPLGESGVQDAAKNAVDAFNESDQDNVVFAPLERAQTGHVWGCDWHPGLDTHAFMAQQLSAVIERELGWTRAD